MRRIEKYQNKVLEGGALTKEEALEIADAPLTELCAAADQIRKHFCGNAFDLCAVISAKGGPCPEDCKFCPQSAKNSSSQGVPAFSLLSSDILSEDAKQKESQGIMAYGLVSSGRVLPEQDVEKICVSLRRLKKSTGLRLCGSLGLLDEKSLQKLKDAGLEMIHNNLESSQTFFETMCTTHTYAEKKDTIKAAQAVGLEVCSGGLFGMGETMEDRIELAMEERSLGVSSVPINLLDPVPGTPLEKKTPVGMEEACRITAVLRFLLPEAFLRLAAGREYLEDKGRSCFLSGANAAISGDFLTTMGISIETDLQMLREIGYFI